MALAVVALGACNGGGGDDPKSSPAPTPGRSTTSGPVIPVGRSEVAGALWDGKIAVAGGFPVRPGGRSSRPLRRGERDVVGRATAPASVRPFVVGRVGRSPVRGRRVHRRVVEPDQRGLEPGPGRTGVDRRARLGRPRGARHRCRQRQARRRRRRRRERQRPIEHRDLHARARMVAGDRTSEAAGAPAAAGRATRSTPSQAATRTATRSVESFIIGSDQWNDEGALHDARSGIGAGTTSSGRVCTGGEKCPADRHGSVDRVLRRRTMATGRGHERARHGLAVVAEGKRVHLVAGGPQPGFSFSDAHEVLEL